MTVPTGALRCASGTAASSGLGPETKARPPSSIPTIRSRQPVSVRTNCRTGSASRNSLASSRIGRSVGRLSSESWNCAPASAAPWTARRASDPSTRCTCGRSPWLAIARSASFASVPRPGPSST